MTHQVPGSTDDAVIDILGQNTFTVTHAGSATDVVKSPTSQDALVLSGGSLSLAATSTINNKLTVSATLVDSAALTVMGLFSWGGSTLQGISGQGSLTLAGGGEVGGHSKLDGFTLLIAAGQTLSFHSNLYAVNGAAIDTVGTFHDLATSDSIAGDGSVVFNNYGSFVEAGDPGTGLSVAFNNYGSVDVQQGGSLGLHGPTFNGGTISGEAGSGLALSGSLVTLAPTSSITADTLVLDPASLNIQISGPTSGVGFPRITVGNTAAIGGQLSLNLLDGFTPALGETFTLIHNQGSLTGTFADAGGIVSSHGNQFQISYVNGHVNAASGVSPTLSWSQLAALGVSTGQVDPISVLVGDGHHFRDTASTTVVVAKATPSRTVAPDNIPYGTTLAGSQLGTSLGGVAGTFAFTGADNGTVLNASSTSYTEVYTFTPTDITDYTSATGNATVNVARADLFVTATVNSKTYGATASDTGSVSGVRNSDGFTASFASVGDAATASVAGSPYSIIATLSDPSRKLGNYTVHETDALLTVNQATLTVTANDARKVYGATNPTFTDTITGFVNGDNSSAVSGAATLATAATTSSGVGTYTITAAQGNLSAVNYTFAFSIGTLTVKPAPTSTAGAVSASTSNFGQGLTFTATVTANAPSNAIPTDSVDFFDTTTNTDLGTANLVASRATLTTTAPLLAATQTITLSYGALQISSPAAPR